MISERRRREIGLIFTPSQYACAEVRAHCPEREGLSPPVPVAEARPGPAQEDLFADGVAGVDLAAVGILDASPWRLKIFTARTSFMRQPFRS